MLGKVNSGSAPSIDDIMPREILISEEDCQSLQNDCTIHGSVAGVSCRFAMEINLKQDLVCAFVNYYNHIIG